MLGYSDLLNGLKKQQVKRVEIEGEEEEEKVFGYGNMSG
jgi:hypothetical protein